MPVRPPCVLSIAGSDPSGGAGVQADLKTFLDHGVYGMAAVSVLTVQNTVRFVRAEPVSSTLLADQVRAVLEDLPVDAVKIGMLSGAAQVDALLDVLAAVRAPIVLDPVLAPTRGGATFDPADLPALRRLADRCAVVTPNGPEADALGPLGVPTLRTGGHDEGARVVDVLRIGDARFRFAHPRIRTRHGHGTGCTLSAAIAARLACGDGLVAACRGAVRYVSARLAAAGDAPGHGRGPLLHGRLHRLGVGGVPDHGATGLGEGEARVRDEEVEP